MKKHLLIFSTLLLAGIVFAQDPVCDCPDCREKVAAAAEGKTCTLPGLEGLSDSSGRVDALAEDHAGHDHAVEEAVEDEHAGHDHAAELTVEDEHAGHDHGVEVPVEDDHAAELPVEDEHAGHDHAAEVAVEDEHAGHDHAAEVAVEDEHAGHDHAAEVAVNDEHVDLDHGDNEAVGLEISDEIIAKLGLQILEATGGAVARSAIFPAEIKLNRDRAAAVSPRYPSVVRQVFAEIGDTVKKGDVLASLENRETLSVYTVSAALNGVIISKDLAVGESVDAEDTLFEVANLSSVWADVSIFPKYQKLVRKGAKVQFVAHDGHTAAGVVKYISPIASHETRTFTARCVLTGASEGFTPGVFVRANIVVEQKDAVVVVPREAVQTIVGETVIFTPSAHGFVATPVQVGLADDSHVEIRSGLAPKDRYVAAGAFALKAQMVTSGMDPHAGHGH
jgi:cobalt-zinc-cadmium efflux system membrane fusion protein